MAKVFTVLAALCVLVLSGCAEETPEALPLVGWDGEALDGDQVSSWEAEDPHGEVHEVASFDRYIIDRFSDIVSPSEFYGVQLLVDMHCNGMIGDTGVDYRYGDDAQLLITSLAENECEEVVRSPLLVASPSLDNDSWDEMIDARFSRVVWWSPEEAFAERARKACLREETSFELQGDDNLSRSVVVEIGAIVQTGECGLVISDRLIYEEEFEEAFGDDFSSFTSEEVLCMDDALHDFNRSTAEPPPSIAAEFARLCAADYVANHWADMTSGRFVIGLPERDDRLCFAEIMIEVANSNFTGSLYWYPTDRMRPPPHIRRQLDVRLPNRCGIDYLGGVAAGLEDVGGEAG